MSRQMVVAAALILLFASGAIRAGGDDAASNVIRVEVAGLRNDNGSVGCELFRSADGFPNESEKAIKTAIVKIANGSALCEFPGVVQGDYAVAVFHDENSNGKIDKNFIGMPKEGVGASNDAKGHFGPPKYDDARFKYDGGAKSLMIHVKYLL